jgi:hypothetical protein
MAHSPLLPPVAASRPSRSSIMAVSAAIFSIVSVQIRRQREFGRASDRSPPELGQVGGDVRSGSGTKRRCESSTRRSGAEDKADVQARTHHPFVRV